MSNEYTPTVEQGERAYCDGLAGTSRTRAESAAEYRRMIAEVERKAAQKGWDRGFDAGWSECSDPGAFVNDVWDAKTPNPYGLTAGQEGETT